MLMSYLQAFCFLSSAFYLPMWWQGVKGVTATMSGVHLLPFSLMVSVVSRTSPHLRPKRSRTNIDLKLFVHVRQYRPGGSSPTRASFGRSFV